MHSPARLSFFRFRILVLLMLAGCTTQYGPQGVWGDGYLERRIAPNRWVVLFDASVFTPPDKVARYALYRCAEITLADHAHYFVILSTGYVETHPTKTEPTLVDAAPSYASVRRAPGHSARLLIQTFRDDRPEDYDQVYDAQQLIEENASKIGEAHKS
jgi:hypothetical protein